MNKITVYVKGDAGFLQALIIKLRWEWIPGGQEVDEGVISFALPEKMSMEEFKASIGMDIVSDYNVLFFDSIPVNSQPEAPWTFIPGRPFKMSIWANSDSNLTGTKPVRPREENKT